MATTRIALVTGGMGGLGEAICMKLARMGIRVVVTYSPSNTKYKDWLKEMESRDYHFHGVPCDVGDFESCQKMVQQVQSEIGPIDILINNAGIQKRAPLVEMSLATWEEVVRVNLTGVFVVGQAVGRRMVARRRGKIVNICSLMSEVARKTIAPYTAAKGAVKQLTRAMCVEWAGYNIQVNGIGPGYFVTPMNEALVNDPDFDAWIRSRTPAGRWGRTEELVGAAIFLSSPASDFVNGQIIYVDGGVLAAI